MITAISRYAKTENATSGKPKVAQSVSKLLTKLSSRNSQAKFSKGWQRGMYTRLLPDLYPEVHLRLSLNLGQNADCFHNPRILSNAVPLGFCSGGFSSTSGYDPATSAQLTSSYSPPSAGPVQRGATRFNPSSSRRLFQASSSKAFRLRLRASIELTAAC